jgi:retron-type reverse transcriptase
MIAHRIADRRVLRLIERWLKAGILESGRWEPVEVGTPQGSGISPILANVFLHYIVDLWVHQWRRQQDRSSSADTRMTVCHERTDSNGGAELRKR